MPTIRLICTLLLAVCAAAGVALAQEENTNPLPVDPASIDFTGTWHYSTTPPRVSGMCPAGAAMSGTLFISQEGGEIGLMVQSGAVCNPASMCMYGGGIADGAILVSNQAIVDEEGGSATNAMQLFFSSPSAGLGSVASGYVHPGGFECQWSYDIMLWRSEGAD